MTDILKKWLKHKLDNLTTVKRCTFGQDAAVSDPVREADVVVHTWSGIHVHIHLLDTPVNVRTIRRIVESATRVGIGTLFLVDVKQLPRSGERVPADKWFVAIHALLENRLYAYEIRQGSPVIHQVHFAPCGRAQEVETRHGPNVAIEELRCYRSSVKLNLIKGYWMVADFGPDVTRKKSAPADSGHTYHDPRWQHTRFQTSSTNTQQRASSTSANDSNGDHKTPPPPPPPVKKTRLERCYELLGVQRHASREEVKAAFRKLAFAVHPDVSDLPKAEAEERFKTLSEAYEYIRSAQGW